MVTGKVTGSCRWCYHDNHPQWPSDAERENVEKKPKKKVFTCLMRQMKGTSSERKLM